MHRQTVKQAFSYFVRIFIKIVNIAVNKLEIYYLFRWKYRTKYYLAKKDATISENVNNKSIMLIIFSSTLKSLNV